MGDTKKLENQRNVGSTKGTFMVSVKFTQNSTWQGELHWVEKNQKQNFRSALEMIKLIDEALEESMDDFQVIKW